MFRAFIALVLLPILHTLCENSVEGAILVRDLAGVENASFASDDLPSTPDLEMRAKSSGISSVLRSATSSAPLALAILSPSCEWFVECTPVFGEVSSKLLPKPVFCLWRPPQCFGQL